APAAVACRAPPGRARGRYGEALAMPRRLFPPEKYPAGHPRLASSLNNLGSALEALGRADRALSCYEEALAMCRRLYPKEQYPAGHADLFLSLNNLALVLAALRRPPPPPPPPHARL